MHSPSKYKRFTNLLGYKLKAYYDEFKIICVYKCFIKQASLV